MRLLSGLRDIFGALIPICHLPFAIPTPRDQPVLSGSSSSDGVNIVTAVRVKKNTRGDAEKLKMTMTMSDGVGNPFD